MTTHVTIAGKSVSLLQAALMLQKAYRLGVPMGEVGAVAPPEPAPSSIDIGGKRVSIAAGAALAVISDSQGIPARKLLDSVGETYIEEMHLEEEANVLQAAARALETARRAILPASVAWLRGHGYEGRKVPPVDRRLARAVRVYADARQHLERCLYPESSRHRRAPRTR